jgi:hypothetical protein
MTPDAAEKWRTTFLQTVQRHENASPLKDAALEDRLGDWTRALTAVVVATCQAMGWQASARGHQLEMLPVSRGEYLGLDVVAFTAGEKRWRLPVAALELENSRDDDRIAYSLWKVLCVRADLRVLYCYRNGSEEGPALIRLLRDDVVRSMGIANRMTLGGETLIVVGSRADATTFPYGFFKWWALELNTGTFRLI